MAKDRRATAPLALANDRRPMTDDSEVSYDVGCVLPGMFRHWAGVDADLSGRRLSSPARSALSFWACSPWRRRLWANWNARRRTSRRARAGSARQFRDNRGVLDLVRRNGLCADAFSSGPAGVR